MATLGLKEMGKFLWEGLENAKKILVFHFGVGRHNSFPQKPVVIRKSLRLRDFWFLTKRSKNLPKIQKPQNHLDPIKNCVSTRPAFLEAVYLEALLYSFPVTHTDKNIFDNSYYVHS